MKEIPLTQGQFTVVDDADYDVLVQFNWHAQRRLQPIDTFYAYRKGPKVNGKQPTIILHRFLLNPPSHMQIDHINGDSLDNRRENLRFATTAQNGMNSRRFIRSVSGFRGVVLHKRLQKWQAGIKVSGRSIHLGIFEDPEEAARVYDNAARTYFGEFARLNFPHHGERGTA